MILISSLSPNHKNNDIQHDCIKSWKQVSDFLFSINTEREIEQLQSVYKDIIFISTNKTIQHLVGKSLVTINSMIDFGIKIDDDILIINSDIIIDSLPELKNDGITIFSRWDYKINYADAQMFQMGFDMFHVPKHLLKVFPPTIFALGSPWHDFATPYIAILKDIPVYWPQAKHIYHKLHKTQYNVDEWIYMGEFFRLFFKLPKNLNIGEIATDILTEIKSIAIK